MNLLDCFRSETIIRYDAEFQKLEGNQKYKAKKLLVNDLVHKVGDSFVIEPIKGYNKSTYYVRNYENTYTCTCQYYNRYTLNTDYQK